MYDGDSFFTLSRGGQIGLAMLSLTLWGSWFWIVRRLTRFSPLWARLVSAIAAFWLFVWLSPQVYYMYYLMVISGLPMQIVVQTPPDLSDLGHLLLFQSGFSLSAHSQAILGWSLILAAAKKSPQRSELTAP
ncbi:hypothetical protein [Leisingera sp. F5]|uniref:hypothetical protein n=1 Tax=Leisingera sp. F5 TaxID=1813816 RepID=UPI000A59D28C|nr:hypothetical protein [Leisingera sp. F5]